MNLPGKPPQKLKHKIKAQHVISPRTIPRPPSHHALRRLRDKTTPENPTTPKDNITLKKISLKNTYSNHEDTFYTAFNSTQSAEPPKAEKAPSEIQLELPSDQMFSPVSRASTTLSITKISLNVSSACNKDSEKITMQSRKEKHQNTPRSRPITRDNRSRPVTRDTGTRLSVKTVKNAAVYVKKANRLKGVKLKPKVFKKNVKVVGIIKTPKRKHEKSVTDEKNGKNLVEANSLIPVAITEAVRNTNANTKNKPGTESDEMQANCIDIEDANFFMCSNETDGLPLAEKEHNRTIEVKLSNNVEQSIHTQEHRPQSPVTVKPMPAKHHKFVLPKFKNVQPPAFNFSAIVDKAKQVSKSKANKLTIRKDIKTDTTTEQSAISSFIKDLKLNVKRSRRKKKQEMPALSRYARIPTLINWVEYSDLLRTPSMQMQQRLSSKNTHM